MKSAGEWKPIRLNLLGAADGSVRGRAIHFRTRKALALVAYLALNPGQHPRDRLADLLWPGVDLTDARARLRNALTYIREAFGSEADQVLSWSRETLTLHKELIDVDLDALAAAERLIRQPLGFELRAQLESAAGRYRGPFLDGLVFSDAAQLEDWVDGQRRHWRAVVGEILDRLSRLQLEAGDAVAAVASLERWTAADPDEEFAWERLLETDCQLGDRLGARRAWSAYRCLIDELGVQPSETMRRLHDQVVSSKDPPRRAQVRFGREELSEVPFVGRRQEWAQLTAAYRSAGEGRTNVLVLQGPDGAGKSRLASQFASSLLIAGADVVSARSFDELRDLPYAVVVDGLRRRLEAENAPDDLLGDLWLAELTRLLPELKERYPDLPRPVDDPFARGRVFEAVTRLGLALASRRPVVWILDDVQWSDPDSRDCLRYAVRRWRDAGARMVLILTTTEAASVEVKQWLAALERETAGKRIDLGPLRPDEVAQLVAMLAGKDERNPEDAVKAFGRWLAERTEGRPLPVTETIRRLIGDGTVKVHADEDSRVVLHFPETRTLRGIPLATAGQ